LKPPGKEINGVTSQLAMQTRIAKVVRVFIANCDAKTDAKHEIFEVQNKENNE